MKFVTGYKKGAFLTLAAALAVIFAATIVMNALREYDAVRPVEFFIAPICAAAAALFIRENKTEGTLVVAALLSTTCADFFMVILEDFYLISLTFFSAAQLLYYARILLARAKEGKKYIAASVCIRAAVSIAVCAAAPFVVPQAGALAAFAAFYFINLAANCAEACVLCVYVKGRGRQTIFSAITFAAGLALFVGCDVCVALNVARVAGITLGDGAIYAVNILIWIFYAPSQAALALSATVRLNKNLNEEPLGGRKKGVAMKTENDVKAGKAVNYIVTAVFAAMLFIFLLSFSISLPILNRWFYYIQINTLHLEEASGYTYAEIKEAFDEIMDYLLLPGREFGEGVFPYSESGAAHFMDCKPLFVLDVALAGASAGIVLIIAVLHFTKVVKIGRLRGLSATFWTALAAIIVPIILGCLIASDFDSAFVIFHSIFFPGKDNWQFNPRTDPIINVLPEQFFMNCAIFIGVGLVVFSAAAIAGSCIARHIRKKNETAFESTRDNENIIPD